MQEIMEKVGILLEALPYIREFNNSSFVIKYGGSAQMDPVLKDKVAQDIVLLKLVGINVIVVHGGGKHINQTLEKFGIKSEFKNGLRVTDDHTMEVTEMVLSGKSNKEIVTLINKHGGHAIGISGKDGPLLYASSYVSNDGTNYGRTGKIDHVEHSVIEHLESSNFIPVISPVAIGTDGNTYNVNADEVASKVAEAVNAEKLIYLTDVDGILADEKDGSSLIHQITEKKVNELIEQGVISGGMLPKVKSIYESLHNGVDKVHIINGTTEHSLLLEIFTQGGIGTQLSL